MNSHQVRFVLGIAAGKGGVGKSTLTVNLALALTALGWRVGILDADLYGPSLSMMMPPESLPSASLTDPKRIVPALSCGIKGISYSHFAQEGAMVRAPIANGFIKQLIHQVDWAPLDCLLIDFPPGTGDIQLTLMQEGGLSGGVIVTTPQEVALLDVVKAMGMFGQMNIPIVGVVENMSYFQGDSEQRHYPFGQGGGKRLSERFAIPLLGEIPIDPRVSQCGDEGLSLFQESPSSALVFTAIAQLVIEQLEALSHLEGLKNFEMIRVQQIVQKEQTRFTIEWTDGKLLDYCLAELQRLCPCARCRDEKTGEVLVDPASIPDDLEAVRIVNVGRYALQITFTSGCSKGIYPYRFLRELKNGVKSV